jgi:hydrogenase maturation protease
MSATERTKVTVLVCGSPDRGDDAAAMQAVELLRPETRRRADVRIVGQLGVEQLVDRRSDGAVIVVDAALGLAPGRVARLSFAELRSGVRSPVPRSSHELPIPEVVGIAELIGGPLVGGLVVIGGLDFSLGAGLSPQVREGLAEFAHQIAHAIEDVPFPRGDARRAETTVPQVVGVRE